MGDTEAEPIEGALISTVPTRQEQARHSALFVAVDVAKQIPARAAETVQERLAQIFDAAEQLYPWLLGPDAPESAS
jgi:hypothetical protein